MAYEFVVHITCDSKPSIDELGVFDQSNADQEVAQILEQIVKDVDAGKFPAHRFPHNFVSYRNSEGSVVATARYEPL